MPGIGIRTAARILIDVGDGSGFTTAGHLAAYAGLAPVTRSSGSSIRGEHPSRRGNKQLKRAFYLAAFASLSQPESRAYYDRKRREGKHHIAALIALARRRIDVLFAMLRDGTFYQPPHACHGLTKTIEAPFFQYGYGSLRVTLPGSPVEQEAISSAENRVASTLQRLCRVLTGSPRRPETRPPDRPRGPGHPGLTVGSASPFMSWVYVELLPRMSNSWAMPTV
ncbi:hypothetical protein QFZ68_006177 [Streptomyces sp. V1I6]|nr:hypothetical protein [Streptomyces sp. V1I6]